MPRLPPGHGPLRDRDLGAVMDALAAVIVPKGELEWGTPYQLLVAVVLSAQCTDKAVNAATRPLFARAGTPAAMLRLGEARLAEAIRTIGLWRAKARHVIGLSRLLLDRHGGEVPGERAALEALPGVGRKTAAVVLNIAFGQPTIAVDTHVQRVATRLGIVRTTAPERTEAVLEARIPERHRLHAHHYFILHGRYTCTARAPRCGACPVAPWCGSRREPA